MNELNQRWREYQTRVIPRNAPPLQMVECKRAYFAGAAAILDVLGHLDTSYGVSMVQRERELEALSKEVGQFRLEVAADRA